jgi:hypothetical protein
MRQVHRADEKAFVDFSGKRPVIYDATTGEIQPVELFVGVLGASSYLYAEACPSQEHRERGGRQRRYFRGHAEAGQEGRGHRNRSGEEGGRRGEGQWYWTKKRKPPETREISLS